MADFLQSLDPSTGALAAAGVVFAGYLVTIEPVLFAIIDMNRMFAPFGGRNQPTPDEVQTYSYCGRASAVGFAIAILIVTNSTIGIDPFLCMLLCPMVCVPLAMGVRFCRDRNRPGNSGS